MRTRKTPPDQSITFTIVCVLILIAGVVTQCRYMRDQRRNAPDPVSEHRALPSGAPG